MSTKLDKAERLKISLNFMYMFVDAADAYACEVESLLKHNNLYRNSDKQVINRIKKLTSSLITSIDRSLGTTSAEKFGDDCDFIREVCEICAKSKDEETNLKILSALKLIVK